MKKRLMGILCLTGMVLLGGCGSNNDESTSNSSDSWETIQEAGSITVGLDDTFVPMGFRDESGEIVGFDVDLAKAVFEEYDVEVEFQPIDWSLKETELGNGTIDLIWNGYSVTDARKEKVLFTDTYMKNDRSRVRYI